MKAKINIGDLVEVTRPYPGLTLGSKHLVYDIYDGDNGGTYISLSKDGRENMGGWDIDRFVKYKEKEKSMQESNKVANAIKIEIGKKYRMVGTHEPVRVICTDRADPQMTCIALFTSEFGEGVLFLDSYGRSYGTGQQILEEVPAVDWSKVKTDTPIWIKYAGEILKRHFSSFDGMCVYFYPDGTTSFTCPDGENGYSEPACNCWLEGPK